MNAKIHTTIGITQPVDRGDIESEYLELLGGFDRDEKQPVGAYAAEFTDTQMILAERYHTDITSILSMDSQTVIGFKSTIKAIAQSGSRSPLTLRNVVGKLEKALKDTPIKEFTVTSYPNFIRSQNNASVNLFLSLFNVWYRLGYPGLNSETMDAVNFLKRPAMRHRVRIKSEDPTEGWYTTQEYDDLVDTYWLDYESGKVGLRDTTAFLLNAQYGRRGIQLAGLKICDFEFKGNTDGVSGKRVSFPGAKDRNSEEWFRGSKTETHPMGDDLWDLCKLQIEDSITTHEKVFQRTLTAYERDQLPFLRKDQRGFLSTDNAKLMTFSENDFSKSFLHLTAAGLTSILSSKKGTPVISQRTGQPIRQFAYRMRYTRARQLARMGVPRLTLQYWLGQEHENSLEHYYDDPAEDARLLNTELQIILGPLSQAFAGSIRDKESDATRGNDPSSRIELDGRHSVGSCGEHGFCSASVPIPCYRCSKFEPWVDAPHEEVLIRLIERQEEENNIHLPSKARRMLVPLQLDKDIAAVRLVIQLCDARKQELNKQPTSQRKGELKEELANSHPKSSEHLTRKKKPVPESE